MNVRELKSGLHDKIFGLGIDSNFLDNPAFSSVLSEIAIQINSMNMNYDESNVMVLEDEGKLSFNWISGIGEKFSIVISSSSPTSISCIKTEERVPYENSDGQIIRSKIITEDVATIDSSGFITLKQNGASLDNLDCVTGECRNSTYSNSSVYNNDGVMITNEYKEYGSGRVIGDIDRISTEAALSFPRNGNNNFTKRSLLNRDKLDTARFYYEDKDNNILYSSMEQLSQEHGLRDMSLPAVDLFSEEVIINPISQQEISDMIQRENNPKVAEGLKKYAEGRENYYYNSSMDNNFARKGFSQSVGISR